MEKLVYHRDRRRVHYSRCVELCISISISCPINVNPRLIASWLKNKTDEVLTIIGLAFVEIATTDVPLNMRVLSKHSIGAPAVAWNRFLKDQGFLTEELAEFGKQTQKATMVFQKVNKVKPTGSVDPRTLEIARKKGFSYTLPALSPPAPEAVLRKELERLNEF